jgi:predicted amidohydrolase YtcJ
VLYRGGRVRSPADPRATALLVEDGRVAWVGSDAAADSLGAAAAAGSVVDLGGALVTPAFVDAHVHATAAGLALDGLDLSAASSLAETLRRVESHARARRGGMVLGTGWDETRWPEQRPPTARELDRASYGGVVYLARTDVHSAVVSSALLAATPHARGLPGHDDDGWVRLQAHSALRSAAYTSLSPAARRAAQRRLRQEAAALGIACVHEMAGPGVSGEGDLAGLLALAAEEPGPLVLGYWGALGDVDTPQRLGLPAAGGDLFCDGSIGSHTAALHAPYADAPTAGQLRHDAADVAAHVVAATRAGLQSGFHVIGDRALDACLDGFEQAAEAVGLGAVIAARSRLEHVEMAGPDAIARMASLGLVASVQPAFDARWGGQAGLYAQRLGPERAGAMNPYAAFAAAGVPLALGSDAPVTPLDPWAGVRAAVRHRTASSGLSARAAFTAATRGGWRAARRDGVGDLVPGAPAHLAVWEAGELGVQLPDRRIEAWSTDPRAAVAGLPDLDDGDPTWRATLVAGRVVAGCPGEPR